MVESLVNFIRSRASRREARARAQDAVELELFSPAVRRSRWYRRILLLCLITLAGSAFVEVVLTPGQLIRRHFVSAAAATSVKEEKSGSDENNFKLPFGMQTDEEKAKQKQEALDRIAREVKSSREELDDEYQKLLRARDELESHCKLSLKVSLAGAGSSVPKDLADVVANEPTAQIAWASLLQLPVETDKHLKAAKELLDSVSAHLTANSFLEEDDRDMKELSAELVKNRADIVGGGRYVDHIATLKRARDALAHEPPQE